jgi:hypothetical protein
MRDVTTTHATATAITTIGHIDVEAC